jgi:ethanolamine-phosphate phospho-lyase
MEASILNTQCHRKPVICHLPTVNYLYPQYFVHLRMDILNCIQFPAAIESVMPLDGYGSTNYKVILADGNRYLVKIYKAADYKLVREEERIIALIQHQLPIQLPIAQQLPISEAAPPNVYIRVLTFIEGTVLTPALATDALLAHLAQSAAAMLTALQPVESDIIQAHEHDWNLRDALRNRHKMDFIADPADRKIVQHYFSVFENDVLPVWGSLRKSIVHGDLNEANILVNNDRVEGFIDFGDISYAPAICELAILLTYLMLLFPDDYMDKAALVVEHFHRQFPLTTEEIDILPLLIATRLCVSVCNSAEAKARQVDTEYILISEQQAWQMLREWIGINPLHLVHRFRRSIGAAVEVPLATALLERRKKMASPSLSLSYGEPIHLSAALFQYMYDAQGGTYLDAYNNIPHVGHSHPAIAAAAARQVRRLNTNTRYLFDSYVDYTDSLLALFPPGLDKALLVNSGSEASDLATRMAKTVTGRRGIAVLEWGYHGNTQNGVHISSYKFDRKGGTGAQDWVLRLPLPKAYRGRLATAEAYFAEAQQLIAAFESQQGPLAAFIAEPISGCGGQVPLMEGYLALLVPYLRQRGTLVVIDEVQTGFGRLGQWFWGFEMQGIVPDMVVLGKPIANGHPMGGVVTTTPITQAFNNGMEFFSSFGGNPVSCEIAHAVLNTIQQEGLQQQAREVGHHWMGAIRQLQPRYPWLGDVRGAGLFIGVECIDDAGKENTALAQRIKEGLKQRYILSSTDGPLDNTLKMKPPLCFTKANADRFVGEMEAILKTL